MEAVNRHLRQIRDHTKAHGGTPRRAAAGTTSRKGAGIPWAGASRSSSKQGGGEATAASSTTGAARRGRNGGRNGGRTEAGHYDHNGRRDRKRAPPPPKPTWQSMTQSHSSYLKKRSGELQSALREARGIVKAESALLRREEAVHTCLTTLDEAEARAMMRVLKEGGVHAMVDVVVEQGKGAPGSGARSHQRTRTPPKVKGRGGGGGGAHGGLPGKAGTRHVLHGWRNDYDHAYGEYEDSTTGDEGSSGSDGSGYEGGGGRRGGEGGRGRGGGGGGGEAYASSSEPPRERSYAEERLMGLLKARNIPWPRDANMAQLRALLLQPLNVTLTSSMGGSVPIVHDHTQRDHHAEEHGLGKGQRNEHSNGHRTGQNNGQDSGMFVNVASGEAQEERWGPHLKAPSWLGADSRTRDTANSGSTGGGTGSNKQSHHRAAAPLFYNGAPLIGSSHVDQDDQLSRSGVPTRRADGVHSSARRGTYFGTYSPPAAPVETLRSLRSLHSSPPPPPPPPVYEVHAVHAVDAVDAVDAGVLAALPATLSTAVEIDESGFSLEALAMMDDSHLPLDDPQVNLLSPRQMLGRLLTIDVEHHKAANGAMNGHGSIREGAEMTVESTTVPSARRHSPRHGSPTQLLQTAPPIRGEHVGFFVAGGERNGFDEASHQLLNNCGRPLPYYARWTVRPWEERKNQTVCDDTQVELAVNCYQLACSGYMRFHKVIRGMR